ncbi:MAG: thiolase family protein [Sphingomonadales bacterium]
MDVAIIGIGIHPFGRTEGMRGLDQGVYAVRQALKDAGVEWSDVECAFGGSSAAGNADIMVNQLGLTGLQFINVNNGCATGGSAVISAYASIKAGQSDIALAVGFDKHPRGSFDPKPADWGIDDWYGDQGFMLTTQFFALKIQRYMAEFGITPKALALVAEKAFHNGSLNENAWRRSPVDLETIENAPMINDPLNKFMFCSPAEGGVALILASEKKVKELGIQKPVWVKGAAVKTRLEGSFEVFSPSIQIERSTPPTTLASNAAFEMAGVGPEDIDVAQLQDTESGAEIMHMAENGFCADGDQEKWLAERATWLNGKLPVNTDGGCLANGEPIGASGLRQVHENVVQLRGEGGERQVPGEPKVAYSHVYGAPGLSAVAILER